MKNILFYKFMSLSDLPTRQAEIQALCAQLKGKILLAAEGMNGCVSGEDDDIAAFMAAMQERFGTIEFKEGEVKAHTFRKMFVRIRDEIITFKQEIDLQRTAPYIEPQELKRALDNGEEILLLDARNNYESRIGRFKGAVAPNIMLFSELPAALQQMPELKDKRIVTYCTGGIRCEKSSAWMRANGFTNVQQLHGGILRYGLECGDAHWEGKCFVFDQRVAIDIDPKTESPHITACERCDTPCSSYYNCRNPVCDRRYLCCGSCFNTYCSDNCEADALPKSI